MVKSAYLLPALYIPALYCLCYLLGSQEMTRNVLIDEKSILKIYCFTRAIESSRGCFCASAGAIASDRSRRTKRRVEA